MLCASTPPRVSAVPAVSKIAAMASIRPTGQCRNENAEMAPVPHRSVTTRPSMTWLLSPKTLAATDGPSDRYRPPSAQLATSMGTRA